MKTKFLSWFAVLGIVAMSCNEPDDGGHVDPITVYEKINGNWGLMSLKMTDEVAKANGAASFDQNLSTQFNYEDFTIQFNVDEKNRPTTYQVGGDVPPLFSPSGYYALSNDFPLTGGTALRIYLFADENLTQKTGELRLTSIPGSNGQMELQLVRTSGGVPFVSYTFKLNALD